MSDKSVLSSGIKNASYIIHYDFCQKKSEFGNRLNCLQEVMRENVSGKKGISFFFFEFVVTNLCVYINR